MKRTYTGHRPFERRHQWQGTRDLSAFLAIPAALAFQAKHGWERRRQACHALAVDTQRRVCALTGLEAPCAEDDFVQMALLPLPPTEPSALKAFLFERHRIEVPVTSHRGRHFVRAAFQAYNTPADADALVTALEAWLKG